MKRPAFQFYPADWRKDPALSACSLAARGLWIELMCIAHESDQYGTLSINGHPMSEAQLARMVGESPATLKKHMEELETAGVFSRQENGAIFSRRMVKDERIRNIRAEAGKQGGNPNLLGDKVKQKVKQTDKQILTPSSSSSSSLKPVDGIEGVGAPSSPPATSTRKGELCKLLRKIGIDAAPHHAAWDQLLADHTDEAIIAVAEIAKAKKPGQRIAMNYLIPMLADQANPALNGVSHAKTRPDVAATVAAFTGRHQQNPAGGEVFQGTAERVG